MQKIEFEEYCKYCERAKTLSDPDIMLCERLGIVKADYKCKKFVYDPLKRAPRRLEKKPELEFVEI